MREDFDNPDGCPDFHQSTLATITNLPRCGQWTSPPRPLNATVPFPFANGTCCTLLLLAGLFLAGPACNAARSALDLLIEPGISVTRRTRSLIPPSGIDKGTWDYIREPAIAAGYDAGLVGDPLTSQDAAIVAGLLASWKQTSPPVVADFGCGTGRSIFPLLERGCSVLAIDLSQPMLNQLCGKLGKLPADWSGKLLVVQANLLELSGLQSERCDFGLCLYSTFGMIRGRENRARFLREAVRILKPGGRLLLHGHNLWWQLNFPGGLSWLLRNRLQSLWQTKLEFGDRFADQRTIRQLPIRSFTFSSLRRELVAAGFELEQVHPLEDSGGHRSLLVRLGRIRTQGWTLLLRKPGGNS